MYDPSQLTGLTYKWVDVIYREDGDWSFYSIIQAQVPDAWRSAEEVRVNSCTFCTCSQFLLQAPFRDISEYGYATTVGPAEYHEVIKNKRNFKKLSQLVDQHHPEKGFVVKGKPGRLAKVCF